MAVAPASATGVNYVARDARFARLVALILDTIFIGVLTSVATAVFGVTQVTWFSPNSYAIGQATIPAFWTAGIWLVYYTVCEAMFSATPGKALNGLVVVSADGRPLTVTRIVVRNVLRLLDVLPAAYLLGGFFVLATVNSQRIGDIAANTTVVLRRRVIEPDLTRSSRRTARIVLAVIVAALVVFTGAFAYFERPVLVVQQLYDEHQLGFQDVTSYSLGSPTRTLTTVTYPLTARRGTTACTGYVTLAWAGLFGWQMAESGLACPPSS